MKILTKLGEPRVNPFQIGYSIAFLTMTIGMMMLALTSFLYGLIIHVNTEGLEKLTGLLTNGWIWGGLIGLAVIIPLVLNLLDSISAYKNKKQPYYYDGTVLISMGGMILFAIYGGIVSTISKGISKYTYADVSSLDTTGLLIAVIVIGVLLVGLVITLNILEVKTMKKILEPEKIDNDRQ